MKSCLLLALWLFSWNVRAQSVTLRGVVRAKADGGGLPGVTIREKGTTLGTATDGRGRFVLVTTHPTPRLVVSNIGYVTQEVPVAHPTDSLVVVLSEDTKFLSEVVVTALEVPREKRSLGYAVSAVTMDSPAPGIWIRGASSVPAAPRAARKPAPTGSATPGPRAGAGVLTAGEVNDFGKWNLWPGIAQKDLNEWRHHWGIAPLERYSAQLVTEAGFPVVGAPVFLKDSRDSLIWQAQSDNTGTCELWNGLFPDAQGTSVASLQAVVGGKTYAVSSPTVFHNGINRIRVPHPCAAPAVVDIAFVVDATGSMGDEIQYLQAELGDVIAHATDSLAPATLHLASVFYRDAEDAYVTRKTDLSANTQQTIAFIGQQQAGGGGDFPEAVDQALAVAVDELSWSTQAKARLLFLILDAPPHENPQVLASLQRSLRKAAARGIRIIPITASGIDKSTEYLMRSMALATNGTYVFLTDDSGVGEPHIKPTTDKFDIERLNTLLVKLIAKYTYMANCQVPNARLGGKAGTLSGKYQQVADTALVTTNTLRKGKGYSWKCYPNPTADLLHVELEGEIKELFVTDVTGKIVLRAVPALHKATLPLGSFPTGIYFLKFFTGKTWQTARFLVSR